MEATTIKLHKEIKAELDKLREYKNESYEEVIQKLLYIAKMSRTQPELSREAIEAIDKARERMRRGKFVTEAQARKRLGFA